MLLLYWAIAIFLVAIIWRLLVKGTAIRWWYKFLAFIDPTLPVFSSDRFRQYGPEDEEIFY